MSQSDILKCRNISKRYRQQYALRDLDLDVHAGEIFGLLGPNGAGKTTFIRIILGLAAPTTGQISFLGEDIFRRRKEFIRKLGAVVEAPVFFEYMTGWDNLYQLVSLSGKVDRKRLAETLAVVGLAEAGGKKVGAYSYGMKQRLGIAQALLPATRLLILDEPTNGLDPQGIAGIRELIGKLCHDLGITIFLCSHLLAEVERVCDRVAIIHQGEKVLEGLVSDLKTTDPLTEVHLALNPELPDSFGPFKPVDQSTYETNGVTVLKFAIPREDVPELVRKLVQAGVAIHRVNATERSLEDIFLEHTKSGRFDVPTDSSGN